VGLGGQDVPPLAGEHHVCATCQLSYDRASAEAALTAVCSYPGLYRAALAAVQDSVLRQRPEPDVWSILEYTCHVRDVYDVYTDRLIRAVTEDRPTLEPMHNERRAARGRYNDQDPDEVWDALGEQAARFVARATSITPGQYSRVVTRLPGEERTVLWLIQQASHEGRHHLNDIEHIRAWLAHRG
jgi:hypothetical protein